jgi:hypothetical protein
MRATTSHRMGHRDAKLGRLGASPQRTHKVCEIFHFLQTNASAIVAALALVISVVSVGVSRQALEIQRRHNILSVRPLPEITVADYEDSLRVRLRNNGSGPMIIRFLAVSNGSESKSALIDCMPDLPSGRAWADFVHSVDNRSLLAGAEINLLELTKDNNLDLHLDGGRSYEHSRDLVRAALSTLTVTVTITDVYDTVLPVYSRKLDWFGRHSRDK